MSVCACCPLYCYWVPLRRVLLHHLYSLPSDICIYTSRPSLAGLKVSSLSLCDIPLSSLGSFYRLAPICPCFSCTGEPSINHSTSDVASWVGSKGHLPLLAGGICPNAAQEAAGCLYCEGSVLAHDQHGAHRTSQSFSAKLLSSYTQRVLVLGVLPPYVQNFAFPFLNFTSVLLADFFSLR